MIKAIVGKFVCFSLLQKFYRMTNKYISLVLKIYSKFFSYKFKVLKLQYRFSLRKHYKGVLLLKKQLHRYHKYARKKPISNLNITKHRKTSKRKKIIALALSFTLQNGLD